MTIYYRTADVVRATGTPPNRLQRYLERNYITMQPCDVASEGLGHKRGFSFRRVVQVAITSELIKIGISPSRAAKAAFAFSDTGGSGRSPCRLYALGKTFLVGVGTKHLILNQQPDQSLNELIPQGQAAFVIDLGQIVAGIQTKLEK